MGAPDAIRDLVRRFEEHREAYRSGRYNETQLRRYTWSAKLPLSTLTDFDEFAVFDRRSRPDLKDKPALGRILYLTAADYADRREPT